MDTPNDTPNDNPKTQITTRAEFAAALRHVLQQAAANGTRELWLVDADFESWPLDDPGFLDELTRWARLPRRRAVMLAAPQK